MRKVEPQQTNFYMLVEGDPGSGKTTFMDTANNCDRTRPALHLDLRGNTIALGAVTDWEHYIVELENLKDLTDVYNWFGKGQPQDHEIAEWFPKVKFNTLIIDQLTELHNMMLYDIVGYKKRTFNSTMPQAQIQHWGELLRRTSYFVGKLLELDVHVFMGVQSIEKQDQTTGAIMHRPQLWGQSEKAVPAYVYVHMYILQSERLTQRNRRRMGIPDDVAAEDRVGLFTPRFDSMAKDQTGKLGTFMINPTVPKMVEAVYGSSEV